MQVLYLFTLRATKIRAISDRKKSFSRLSNRVKKEPTSGKIRNDAIEKPALNVQFAGTLKYQLQLSEVLRRVMEGQPEALSALLLTDEQNGRHGTICISQSRYISGAELKNSEYERICTGYEALKIIAGLVSANFKYIIAPPEFFENTELTLNIEIEKILLCLPELPEDVSELQDSDSLLDRVFASDELAVPSVMAAEVQVPATEEKSNNPKKKPTWHSVPVKAAAQVFADEQDEDEEEEEPKRKYTTMEQRALQELGPPSAYRIKKKKPLIYRVGKRIGYFFYSLYTAPAHAIKMAMPVLIPLLVIGVLYQVWNFVSPMVRNFKLPTTPPATAKHQAPASDRPVRSAPAYHVPAVRHAAAAHPAATSNTITITQPVDNKPIVPYTTPENPPIYPHRRAYQVVPQAHPSNSTITTPTEPTSAPEAPHSVPASGASE